MIKDSSIVIVAHVPWEWPADYINQTAQYLGARNFVVCFYWVDARSIKEHLLHSGLPMGFRRLRPGIYAFHGVHVLPFRRFFLIEQVNLLINILLVRLFIWVLQPRSHMLHSYIWFFDPRMYRIAAAFGKTYISIYDCVDYFCGDPRLTPTERTELATLEQHVLRSVRFAFVNSDVLWRLHSPFCPTLVRVPSGFRLESFMDVRRVVRQLPNDKPIIGYVGAINHRIDFRLLVRVAKALSGCRFVLVGPFTDKEFPEVVRSVAYAKRYFFSLPNVTYVGSLSKRVIPGIIRQFAIGIIPYKINNAFNLYSHPMKLYEYFYMGKPVVASPIEELKQFSTYVRTGDSVQSWERHIRYFLRHPHTNAMRSGLRKIAVSHSWKAKIRIIESVLSGRVPKDQ